MYMIISYIKFLIDAHLLLRPKDLLSVSQTYHKFPSANDYDSIYRRAANFI